MEERPNLAAVVVIIDLRHELKQQDLELVDWLRHIGRPYLLVYTKADKLSRNQQEKNAALLDAALKAGRQERIIFSSQTGQGRDQVLARIQSFMAGTQATSGDHACGQDESANL